MNKIFKKIWNKRRGCFVAVSEAMSSVCQGKTKAVLAASLLLVAQVPAFALDYQRGRSRKRPTIPIPRPGSCTGR